LALIHVKDFLLLLLILLFFSVSEALACRLTVACRLIDDRDFVLPMLLFLRVITKLKNQKANENYLFFVTAAKKYGKKYFFNSN
jgi:hypothetical protein